jgi:hypothetical protein
MPQRSFQTQKTRSPKRIDLDSKKSKTINGLSTQKVAKVNDLRASWLTKIPMGSHGSNPTQKRFWKVTSDFVRIRDSKLGCIVCGRITDLQAGHYKSWASCRGFSKWDMKNIFGECAYCNTGFNGNEVGAKFKENIIKRHGQERMDYIENLSSYPSEKMDDYIITQKIKAVIEQMALLPEQPEYYQKVISTPFFYD